MSIRTVVLMFCTTGISAALMAQGPTTAPAQTTPAPAPAVKLPYLGLATTAIDAAAAKNLGLPQGVGLRILFVEPQSPADQAGVKLNDILARLDDQLLINNDQLGVLVRNCRADQQVQLTVYRDGQKQLLPAKLRERQQLGLVSGNTMVTIAAFAMSQPANAGRVHSTQAQMTDKQHQLALKMEGDHKTLTVIDSGSKGRLFDGPVDTDQERKALPAGVLPKLQKLEKDCQAAMQRAATAATRPATASAATPKQIQVNDGQHVLTLTRNARNEKHLLVKEAQGDKVIYDGPVDAEQQRQQLSPEILKKLIILEARTQPIQN